MFAADRKGDEASMQISEIQRRASEIYIGAAAITAGPSDDLTILCEKIDALCRADGESLSDAFTFLRLALGLAAAARGIRATAIETVEDAHFAEWLAVSALTLQEKGLDLLRDRFPNDCLDPLPLMEAAGEGATVH